MREGHATSVALSPQIQKEINHAITAKPQNAGGAGTIS